MGDQIAMLCDSNTIIANNNIKLAFWVSETDKQRAYSYRFYYILLLLLSMRVARAIFPIGCAAHSTTISAAIRNHGTICLWQPFYLYTLGASHRCASYFGNPFRIRIWRTPRKN